MNILARAKRQNTTFADKCVAFNLGQTEPGSLLKTLKGSIVERYRKLGFGKKMSNKFYFHKDYANKALSDSIDGMALLKLAQSLVDFNYNIIRWDPVSRELALEEVPDFDTAREPTVGRVLVLTPDEVRYAQRPHRQIIHHKWTMVDNSYSRFDIYESWIWSRTWLNVLKERADGSNLENWKEQLSKYNLE